MCIGGAHLVDVQRSDGAVNEGVKLAAQGDASPLGAAQAHVRLAVKKCPTVGFSDQARIGAHGRLQAKQCRQAVAQILAATESKVRDVDCVGRQFGQLSVGRRLVIFRGHAQAHLAINFDIRCLLCLGHASAGRCHHRERNLFRVELHDRLHESFESTFAGKASIN